MPDAVIVSTVRSSLGRAVRGSLAATRPDDLAAAIAHHAFTTGEGAAFVAAGVEPVSRFGTGTSDSLPDTMNPEFDRAGLMTMCVGGGRGMAALVERLS
jgi:acetyl-CoA acetyltransferase